MQIQLSAVIITYNEERNIKRCIESLIGLVDEIVVVDSGSSDSTKVICEQFPVHFITTSWLGYGATKNFGAEQAKGLFILSIDADEAVSPELRESLKARLKHLDGLYSFNRLTSFCGHWIKYGDWYPDHKVRLYPKGVLWNTLAVHEQLMPPEDMPQTKLSGDLLHYSFNSLNELQVKNRKYAELAADTKSRKSILSLSFSMIFSPVIYFVKNYMLKAGFLDGKAGFTVYSQGAYCAFLKYKLGIRIRQNKGL